MSKNKHPRRDPTLLKGEGSTPVILNQGQWAKVNHQDNLFYFSMFTGKLLNKRQQPPYQYIKVLVTVF